MKCRGVGYSLRRGFLGVVVTARAELSGRNSALMRQVTRHTSHVTRHTSHVTRHTSHVTRHTSHITRHTSHVTRHTSHVTRHTFRYMQILDGTVCEAADPVRAHLKSAQWLVANSTTKIDKSQPPTECYIGTILRVI